VTNHKTNITIGRKLEEVKLYINRTLEALFNSTTYRQFSFDQFYNWNQQTQFFLLSDSPGNGKSTEMKMIARRLKQKNPSRWVLYFDLKKFTDTFKSMAKTETSTDVARFMGRDMMKLDEFELEIFKEQFENGLVILKSLRLTRTSLLS
jgi:energy-coupling factor transporter ATP-binding protein EcfA2